MSEASPPPSRFTRRRLLRYAALGLGAVVLAEALRVFALTNRHTVDPGKVYRTAQLSGEQLSDFIREKGIRTVVNLRGFGVSTGWFQQECRTTHDANVSQEDITFSAKRLPAPTEVRRLIDIIDHTEYPLVFHCQRGADRTGLASAIYLLLQPTSSLSAARYHMSPRFGHVQAGRAAAIDEFLVLYEEWLAAQGREHQPDQFRAFVAKDYVPGQYRAKIEIVDPKNVHVPRGKGFVIPVRVTNESVRTWQLKPGPAGAVHMRYVMYGPDDRVFHEGFVGLVRKSVAPGESFELAPAFPPITLPGHYNLGLDFRDAQAIDLLDSEFAQFGSEPTFLPVDVQ